MPPLIPPEGMPPAPAPSGPSPPDAPPIVDPASPPVTFAPPLARPPLPALTPPLPPRAAPAEPPLVFPAAPPCGLDSCRSTLQDDAINSDATSQPVHTRARRFLAGLSVFSTGLRDGIRGALSIFILFPDLTEPRRGPPRPPTSARLVLSSP